MRNRVSAAEWRWVAGFAAIVMLITTLPYLIGVLAAGDTWRFGGFVFGTDDGCSYLAKMRLGARGDWLFTLRYTHEPHAGALLFLPYVLLGKLAAFFADPASPRLFTALVIVFHAARIVFGAALIAVCYRFVAVFLPGQATRRFALVVIALGGGLGWLLLLSGQGLFGSLPVDWFVPEGYSFLILFGLPHLALARASLLGGLLLLFRAVEQPVSGRASLRQTILAGLLWLVTGLCVPFYVAVLYVILGCWGVALWLRGRRCGAYIWRAGTAALIPLPLLAYTGVVFLTNDALGRWSAQNDLPSPHPLHYVLGYGVLALPAVIGARWAWRGAARPQHEAAALLVAWVIAVPVLIYLPIGVQRRLAEGVIVPLSILAAIGLRLRFPTRRLWSRARTAVLLLVLPTTALLVLGGAAGALTPSRPIFQATADLAALDRLNAIAPRDAVVLCLKQTGNYLPARTDLIAYVGHGPETLHSEQKEQRAEQFYAGQLSAEERRALLAHIDYVYWGLLERERAGAPPADLPPDLRRLDGFGADIVVFEVLHES